MYLRLFASLTAFLALQARVMAADPAPVPVGWYEMSIPGLSVTKPAIEQARKTLAKLPIRLVTLEEFAGYLKSLDQKSGILDQAGRLISRGKELHLGLKLGQAVNLYQQAIQKLEKSFVSYYQPTMLAEPTLQLGVALFQSKRKDEARRAFMRAAVLSPGLKLAEGYYSPSIRAAYKKARDELGKLEVEPPPPEEIGRVCSTAMLKAMLVVSVERLGDRPLLRLSLFDARSGKYSAVETAVIGEKDAAGAGKEVANRLTDDLAAVVGIAYVPPAPTLDGGLAMADGAAAQEVTSDPWYVRHWWIWPVSAAVIAGVAITLPLTVFREDVVDVRVRY
jgi:tetratricopeptide (TPR) repeat protein